MNKRAVLALPLLGLVALGGSALPGRVIIERRVHDLDGTTVMATSVSRHGPWSEDTRALVLEAHEELLQQTENQRAVIEGLTRSLWDAQARIDSLEAAWPSDEE